MIGFTSSSEEMRVAEETHEISLQDFIQKRTKKIFPD